MNDTFEYRLGCFVLCLAQASVSTVPNTQKYANQRYRTASQECRLLTFHVTQKTRHLRIMALGELVREQILACISALDDHTPDDLHDYIGSYPPLVFPGVVGGEVADLLNEIVAYGREMEYRLRVYSQRQDLHCSTEEAALYVQTCIRMICDIMKDIIKDLGALPHSY